MLKRWRVELLALVVAIAIGVGLGVILGVGGSSESEKVSDAATGYLQAFANDDPKGLCAELSPTVQARMKAAQVFGAGSCEDTARTSILGTPAKERAALKDAKITAVSIDGDRASVQFSPKLKGSSRMQLVKVGDTWLVNAS
jgi:hypothetical protein